MTNPRRIKAIAGNSASCLGFSIALLTGSIPAASHQSTRGALSLLGSFLVAASSATLAFSPAWGIYGLPKRYWDERG